MSNNLLYLGDALSNFINVERKTYTYLDYVDYGFATDITNIDDRVITIDSGSDNIAVGDILFQSSTVFSIIDAVDVINSTVTIQTDPGFTTDPVDVLKAIDTKITWAPIASGNPGVQKQYHTATLLFKADFNGTGGFGFNSDMSQFDESVTISGTGLSLWGLFPWGEAPWGGVQGRRAARQWVPRSKQRCTQLTVSFSHAYGYSPWQLQGLTVFGTMGSDRVAV